MEKPEQLDLSHHKQQKYCTSRPKYRDARRLTAVKVYTVVNESRYLLVFGVPRINLHQEVKQLFANYGTVSSIKIITDELQKNKTIEIEQFTDCYYVEYEKVHSARRAKHMVDRKNFYGGVLHLSYAPEYESVADVREKLKGRIRDVSYRLNKLKASGDANDSWQTFDDADHEPLTKMSKT